MTRELRLWASSADCPDEALATGRDLVLELEPAHGLLVPLGVALDDHLDGSRDEVDALARRNFAAWRATVPLDFDGLDPADALELELMTRVFMPCARLAIGLRQATDGIDTLEVGRLDPGLARVASALAEEAGLAVRHDAVEVPSRPVRRGLTDRAFSFAGVPGRPRGSVACVSYWQLKPVIARLVAEGPTPVAAGVILPGLDRRDTLSAFVRGGMLGHPGPWSKRRVARTLRAPLSSAPAVAGSTPASALDDFARHIIADRAPELLVRMHRAQHAFAVGSLRLALVPFDSPAEPHVLVAAARLAGRPSLLVQHGFDARLGVPDKRWTDVAALWSERDAEAVAENSGARAVVTGNPGAEHLAVRPPAFEPGGPVVVLVDYPSRMSARVHQRVSARHVATAIAAARRALPGTPVVVRPHPSDAEPGAYGALGTRVDATTGIEQLLERCSLCIGSVSTATLQSAAMGIPTIQLDVSGADDRPWPLDGSVLPRARDEDELVALMAGRIEGSAESARVALGVRRGATSAVVDLITELIASDQPPTGPRAPGQGRIARPPGR